MTTGKKPRRVFSWTPADAHLDVAVEDCREIVSFTFGRLREASCHVLVFPGKAQNFSPTVGIQTAHFKRKGQTTAWHSMVPHLVYSTMLKTLPARLQVLMQCIPDNSDTHSDRLTANNSRDQRSKGVS